MKSARDMLLLSAVQFCPTLARNPAEVSNNIRQAESLIKIAARLGSSMVVLPELAFTGYSFMDYDEACTVSELPEGRTFRAMSALANELGVFIAWGYVECESAHSGKLYNAASLCGPEGQLITGYRKLNLWGNDFLWAQSGQQAAEIIDTPFGKVSLAICRDLRNKLPRVVPGLPLGPAADRGLFNGKHVDVVAAPANWGPGGFPSTTWMDFAAENQCVVVVANRWGVEKNADFEHNFGPGGSCVIDKSWKVHTSGMKFNKNCVVLGAIPEA